MKNLFLLIIALSVVLATGCKKDVPELGPLPNPDQVSFRVEQDYDIDAGGNTVILISETPEAVPIWDYGTGRSNKTVDTVRFAFQGDYVIKYSALTGGGVVEKDPVTITVTEDNLSYVDDPLWTALSGGVGNSKTWLLDLDAEGVSKYFDGPQYFYGTDNGWLEGGDNGCYGDDCWNWNPDWAGNDWIMPAADYGTMTFSLAGGPFVTTNHLTIPARGEESGTFFLDVGAKSLTMTDATILHPEGIESCIADFSNLVVFSLTEDYMQLGALRKDECDGASLLVYNFISKEYSDNWVPVDEGDPNIDVDLGGDSVGDVLSVTSTKTWSLSPDSPFDWTDLEGNLLNGWQSVEEYPDWTGFDASVQAEAAKNQIQFSSNGAVKLIYADGHEEEGSHSTEEGTNIITFDGVTPAFPVGSWVVVTTTEDNQWKVVKTEVSGGIVTDIWFGKRDPEKAEYMVFHFVLGSSEVDPIEAARKEIIAALSGPEGRRTFRVDDTWHVDWLDGDLNGGWTTPTTFADDFTTNSWVWTEAVKEGLQEPRLTFEYDGTEMTCTRLQNGETNTQPVTIDPELNAFTVDMDLIEFVDAASWLPFYGPTWRFCKTPLSEVETNGMWIAVQTPGNPDEYVAIHYVIE